MKRLTGRTFVVGTIVLAVAVGAGTAVAASGGGATSPSAFLDSLAQHLGISREKLDDAARSAAVDQVEAALDAGTITKEQADELKTRIESGDAPLLGLGFGRGFGPGFGHGHGPPGLGGHLSAAAEFLGLTDDELRSRLADGKTLAQIAETEDKSVDGLKQALIADTKQRVAEAVKDGKLTESQAAGILERSSERVDALVTGAFGWGGGRHGFGPPGGMYGAPGMRAPGMRTAPASYGSFAPGPGAPA